MADNVTSNASPSNKQIVNTKWLHAPKWNLEVAAGGGENEDVVSAGT